MKHILALITLLVPTLSFAADSTSAELIQTLIENSNKIRLEGSVNPDDTIASLFGGFFAKQILSAKRGQLVSLNNVSSNCSQTGSSDGQTVWKCTLALADGDYVKTKTGYQGPKFESTVFLTFETTKKSNESSESCQGQGCSPNKHQINDTAVTVVVPG